jgi:rhodanese-related sulfurtransferase/molybdopterin converting factor small subunit
MSARVQLPAALREYAAGATDLEVHAADVDGVLTELARRYPLLRRHLFNDAGALRQFVRVYLNEHDVRALTEGGATPVRAGDVILIVPSIAGGAPSQHSVLGPARGRMEISPKEPVPQITAAELKQRLAAGERIVLIDVREPYEWDIANLGDYGARLIPLGDIVERADELERDVDVVLYCRSGARSAGAVRQLRARGFDNLLHLRGGLRAWAEEIDPDMATY